MNCPHCGSGTPPSDGRCVDCGSQVAGTNLPTYSGVTFAATLGGDGRDAHSISSPGISTAGDAMTQVLPSQSAAPAQAPHPIAQPGSVLTPGQTFGSRYHVIRLLGAGGMGAVYQAWDDELGVAVALKVIRPETITDPESARAVERRFKRELLLARQVTHKNVVRIHDLGEIDGIKYITMPYVQGSDLASILKRDGKVSIPRAVSIARQMAAGLQAAHEVGIVHRDLKPANVMIDENDQALIMDFGIARSVSGDGATAAGAVVGTLEYMAPEQAMGQEVDQRADIYAYGLIVYDMVVGRREATRAESAIAELMGRMKQPPPPPRTVNPDVPEALDALIAKCLDPDPGKRYQTTAALSADLDALSAGGVAVRRLTAEYTAVPRTAPARLPRAWLYGGALALLVVLAVVVTMMWRRDAAGPGPAPAAASLSLAILPFGNATGDASLDSLGLAIADMVRTQLGQSDQLRLVAADRVHQILRDLRIPAATDDAGMLRRIADFTNADTIVAGRYFKVASQIRLAAVIHDARRDAPVPLSAEANSESELLSAVATLTKSIRENLSLGSAAVKELQTRALKPSSQSVQALRLYSEANDLIRRGASEQAIERFTAATQADPSFALAYSKLGETYHTLGRGPEAEKYSSRAMGIADQLPQEERYLVEGTHARITGDLDKAIDAFKNLSTALPGDTEIHFKLAKLYQERGRFTDASASLKTVLEKDPKNLEALLDLGKLDIRTGDFQGALDTMTRALPVAVQLENDELRVSILQVLGVTYRRLNKPDEAIRQFRQALDLAQRIDMPRAVADALHGIALVESSQGQWQAALKDFNDALKIRRDIGDKRGTGSLLIDLGTFYSRRGDRDQALELFKDALQIQREVGNRPYEAAALNNIGSIYLAKGAYDEAQTYLERALSLYEKMNTPGALGDTLHNLAEVSVKVGAYDQALDRYVRALDVRRKANDKRGMAVVLAGQSTLFSLQGRYGAALESAEDAAKLTREVAKADLSSPRVLAGYGAALAQVGRYADAEVPFKDALEQARQQKSDDVMARVLTSQADAQFYQGQNANARRLYQQAIALPSGPGARDVQQAARLQLAALDLRERQGQRAAAALRAVGQLSDAFLSVQATLLAAEADLQTGQRARGQERLETALGKAERLGARPLALQGRYLLMTAAQAAGQKADAERHRGKARELLDEIRKDARVDAVLQRADLKVIAGALGK